MSIYVTQEVVKDRDIVNGPQAALVGNLPLLVKVTILRMVPRLEKICQNKISSEIHRVILQLS